MTTTESNLPDLLPAVRELSRADKLRLIQVLAADLASAEESTALSAGASYPMWTPYHAFDAAAALLRELEAEGVKR